MRDVQHHILLLILSFPSPVCCDMSAPMNKKNQEATSKQMFSLVSYHCVQQMDRNQPQWHCLGQSQWQSTRDAYLVMSFFGSWCWAWSLHGGFLLLLLLLGVVWVGCVRPFHGLPGFAKVSLLVFLWLLFVDLELVPTPTPGIVQGILLPLLLAILFVLFPFVLYGGNSAFLHMYLLSDYVLQLWRATNAYQRNSSCLWAYIGGSTSFS